MKCAKCKKIIPDDSLYCDYCGSLIKKTKQGNFNIHSGDNKKILSPKIFVIFGLAIIFVLVSIILIIVVPGFYTFTPSSNSNSSPREIIKLNYAHHHSLARPQSILAQMFCDEVKNKTDGGVEITCYPDNELIPPNEVATAIETGKVDMGVIVVDNYSGKYPACEVNELPYGIRNGWIATKAANDFYVKFQPAELKNVRVLYFYTTSPNIIGTASKPVYRPEDMKNLSIITTTTTAKIIESLGARTLVDIRGAKSINDLLSKGSCDGIYTQSEALNQYKLKYYTNAYSISYTEYMVVAMNMNKWNSLSINYQQKITEISQDWIDKQGMLSIGINKEAVNNLVSWGRTLIDVSTNDAVKFELTIQPVIDSFLIEKAGKGLPAQEYRKYLNDRVIYWSSKYPSEQQCYDWYLNNVLSSRSTSTTVPSNK